jgi:hypothetical protein
MMVDTPPNYGVPRYLFPLTTRIYRTYLPPLVRLPIIALLGAGLGASMFYLLRKIGY